MHLRYKKTVDIRKFLMDASNGLPDMFILQSSSTVKTRV